MSILVLLMAASMNAAAPPADVAPSRPYQNSRCRTEPGLVEPAPIISRLSAMRVSQPTATSTLIELRVEAALPDGRTSLPDGRPLTFAWSATSGRLGRWNAAVTTWTVDGQGPFTATIEVSAQAYGCTTFATISYPDRAAPASATIAPQATPSGAQQRLPNPVLRLTGNSYFLDEGRSMTRYELEVVNREDFPAELFAPAPALPPCGSNPRGSRTWVDIYDSRGRRLQGFCALGSSTYLDRLWFALREGELPPSFVYVEFTDRQTGIKYRSNLAETTQ